METGSKRKKHNPLISGIMITLLVAVAVLARLNAGNLELKQELEAKAQFLITRQEREQRISREALGQLPEVDFTTTMRTSVSDPTPLSLRGVELNQLLNHYHFTINPETVLVAKALDGYASALSGKEVLEPDNVYICTHMNGQPLAPKKEGGFGPFLLVIKNEQFAQRWCKFLQEIVIQ